MAKNKKSAAKPAKKSSVKAKPAAKTQKAAAPAKAAKTAVKKTVAKKAAPKKPVEKVVAKKKVEPKKAVKPVKKEAASTPKATAPKPVEKVEKKLEKGAPKPGVKTVTVTGESQKAATAAAKPGPPQLNIFPVPNQRPIAHKPVKAPTSADDRTRYSEEELKEFEALINKKLDKAREEYKILKDTLNRNNDEGTDATSGGNTKVLEDGAETAEKENLSQLAARQQKYITNLENALVRIKNGTYGICSVTGKLIPKERLIAVPHTTQSIEAKMMQQD